MESLIGFFFKFLVFLIIILVNIQIMDSFKLEDAKASIRSKFRVISDTESTYQIDYPQEMGLFEYN